MEPQNFKQVDEKFFEHPKTKFWASKLNVYAIDTATMTIVGPKASMTQKWVYCDSWFAPHKSAPLQNLHRNHQIVLSCIVIDDPKIPNPNPVLSQNP